MLRIRKVAVILQLWQNFDRGILQGIAGFVQEHRNWSVFVEEVEHQRIPDFKTWDGDGLIVNFDNRHVVRALRGIRKPVVAVGGGLGWHDPAGKVPYIATGNHEIGRMAADHLLDRGFRQFGFCGYPRTRTNQWATERLEGFQQALARAGHSARVFRGRHTTAVHWDEVQRDISAWLAALPKPIGIMGCYDYRARHVLEACASLGLRVPEDVAVVGVDNDIICDLANPPLSSIEQGRYNIGRTAAATLAKLMEGKKVVPLRQIIPPVGLIARQSTDILCVEDAGLARAIGLIRDQACHGLQAAHVAELAGVSRNTLDKRFKESLGRTVDTEIRRVRLERASELLARSDLPLRLVAKESGFGSEQYLSAVFATATGCRPGEFRARHRAARRVAVS